MHARAASGGGGEGCGQEIHDSRRPAHESYSRAS